MHPAELPGIWKKNLHAIRRARTRHMGKHDESWGLLQQWGRPTENIMVATLQEVLSIQVLLWPENTRMPK